MHFGEFIDDPHSWRQCDTANYIHAFYQDGIDILHPQVCWMGGHKTTILEFPLPEAVVAVFYKIFGPSHVMARAIFFLFFLGAVRYFYLCLREMVDIDLARVATVIYMSLPLGIFYSRAIHVDFSAVMLAHVMFFYLLRGIRNSDNRDMLWGTLAATVGMLIKAPYVFYFALPLLGWIAWHRKWRFVLRFSPLIVLPLGLFVLWRMHTTAVNELAPEWDFIPGYHKFVDMKHWYFGLWEQRSIDEFWWRLWGRFKYEVVGVWGIPFFFAGFLMCWQSAGHHLMRLWAVGTFVYVLIFFTLNLIHDYYQIPLLAPAAFFIAVPIWQVMRLERKFYPRFLPLAGLVLMGLLTWNNIRLTERVDLNEAETYYFKTFFTESVPAITAGQAIREHTPEDALVIISYGSLDCRAPMLLYRARRDGWSVPKDFINPEIVEKLREEGADYLAIVRNNHLPAELENHLKSYPVEKLKFGPENWDLRLFDLQKSISD